VGAGLSTVEQQIRASRVSLEKDIKALSELLAKLGKEPPTTTTKTESLGASSYEPLP
jgi:ferritin-like protein